MSCSVSGLSCGEDNLVTKAYRALQEVYPKLGAVSVHLTKRVPMGAGLGGGSANAAAMLLGLKKLFALPISISRLAKLSAKLGADIPFFIHNYNQAIGLGIGDVLKPRLSRVKIWFVLMASDKGLSTPEVYRNLPKPLPRAVLTKVSRAVTMTCDFLQRRDLARLSQVMHNDLELSAIRLRPSLQTDMNQMHQLGAQVVRMSGSGPTLFAIFAQSQAARSFAKRLREIQPRKKIIVCHTY